MPVTKIDLFNGQINSGVMMVERPIDQKVLPDLRELGVSSIAHVGGGTRISFAGEIPN